MKTYTHTHTEQERERERERTFSTKGKNSNEQKKRRVCFNVHLKNNICAYNLLRLSTKKGTQNKHTIKAPLTSMRCDRGADRGAANHSNILFDILFYIFLCILQRGIECAKTATGLARSIFQPNRVWAVLNNI